MQRLVNGRVKADFDEAIQKRRSGNSYKQISSASYGGFSDATTENEKGRRSMVWPSDYDVNHLLETNIGADADGYSGQKELRSISIQVFQPANSRDPPLLVHNSKSLDI